MEDKNEEADNGVDRSTEAPHNIQALPEFKCH